jgi:hypothetical protein
MELLSACAAGHIGASIFAAFDQIWHCLAMKRQFSDDAVSAVDFLLAAAAVAAALGLTRFDQPSRAGGEVPVLQAVTNACGPHIWLNTIVALTHAGAMPPASGQGLLSWEAYSQQRSQLLQLIIRSASGDARLMNPIAFAESHPGCRRNAQVGC